MGLFDKFLGKEEKPITTYADFWSWFSANEKDFHKIVRKGEGIEKGFFNKLAPKLAELRDGFYYLTGMLDDNTVELILTADGNVSNLVFVEELIDAAPAIDGWKFTAHKPALKIEDVGIEMNGYKFGANTLTFVPVENSEFPDEIEVTIINSDLNDSNRDLISNGIYIFLDNYLGELNFVESIDRLNIESTTELIPVPIGKLKDYILWRQKEFIEKYEATWRDIEKDGYTTFQAQLKSGNPIFAVINTDLIQWNAKASHPWLLTIRVKYKTNDENGLPNENAINLLEELEECFNRDLEAKDGYLNVGRETGEGLREIYFMCKDFRKPSKIASKVIQDFKEQFELSYEIFKDKYWTTFSRYLPK